MLKVCAGCLLGIPRKAVIGSQRPDKASWFHAVATRAKPITSSDYLIFFYCLQRQLG